MGWLHKVSGVMAIYMYVYGLGWGGFWCVSKISRRWPGVGRVLLLDDRGEGMEGKIELAAWFAICFFLVNLAACVLWYAFLYEQDGTVQPGWTDVFG